MPLAALNQQFPQGNGLVGDDPIDPEIKQVSHYHAVVDRPNVHLKTGSARPAQEQRRRQADRNLRAADREAAQAGGFRWQG